MKNLKQHIAPLFLVLIGLTTLSFMAKDSITLRLHPQKGKSYVVNNKATTMNMMEVQGQTINQSQNIDITQSFTIMDAQESQTEIETQVESIKLSISQMGMKMEYDSDHPEKTNPMLAGQTKEFDKVIKKPSTITYDALGKMISDNDDMSMNQLGSAIIKLPEEEVSVGSTWTTSGTQAVSDMEFTVEFTYTVTSISKKNVDVSFTGVIQKNIDKISGTYNGTASLNPNTGLVTKSNMKSNISLTISQQGLTIPMTVVGNTTVTVDEK